MFKIDQSKKFKPTFNTNKIIITKNKAFSEKVLKPKKQNSDKQNIEPIASDICTENLFEVY